MPTGFEPVFPLSHEWRPRPLDDSINLNRQLPRSGRIAFATATLVQLLGDTNKMPLVSGLFPFLNNSNC